MVKEFKLPELGEQIESGDLVKVLVSVGDKISIDQPVIEVETDKADFEVPSTVAGTVKEIRVKEGDKVKVGQVIITVEEEGGESAPAGPAEEEAPSGEAAEPGAGAREEEPEEAEAERPEKPGEEEPEEAPPPAAREKPGAKRGAEAEPGEKEIAAEEGEPSAQPAPERESTGAAPKLDISRRIAPAAPSVRRLARELGVEIDRVRGSGPHGRISAEDVKEETRRIVGGASGWGAAGPVTVRPLPDFTRWGEVERQPMSRIRRKTAEAMSYSWAAIPHVTQYDRADITELEELRNRYGKQVEEAGGKLTVTAIAVKVLAAALKVFPRFAVSLDAEREEIVRKKYFHIGVAVDTDRGLLVPVIRDVDRKNILELSVELTRLAGKARSKKITPEEMEGGVITVTNLGGIGGTQFSPIIYAPEAAILGISRARPEAVYRDGQFEPRLILPVSLSYDHRLIDGADAARFLRWVADALERPFLLSLQG